MDDFEFPREAFGPKMLALGSGRRQRFAWLVANGVTNTAQAARDAGYSDHKEAAKVRGHHLMHDPAVLDAIDEAARKTFRGMAPLAISAAHAILQSPKHPAHARMIETVLDRTGFSAKTEHKVTVEHTVDVAELEGLARRFAEENGIDPRRFIGLNAPKVIEGRVIDGGSQDDEPGVSSGEAGSRDDAAAVPSVSADVRERVGGE